MGCVEKLVNDLKTRYKGSIPFKKICDDENIIVAKVDMGNSINGIYISKNGIRLILLNKSLSYWERRDYAFHELYHHFRSVNSSDAIVNKRDETRAQLFAAICRAPVIKEGDTPELLGERYNITRELATIRLKHELKKYCSE